MLSSVKSSQGNERTEQVDTTGSKCIYCGNTENAFDTEHVFPAGMGGNDSNYLLVDTVCEKCNHNFSKFETTLMRRSVVALARIFLQPYGRRNGEPPEIDTLETHVIDNSGRAIESDHFGSKIETLAQLSFVENTIHTTAKDTEALREFLKILADLFVDKKLLTTEKISQKKPDRFQVSTYVATDKDYILETTQVVSKAPKNTIWLGYNAQLDKDKKPVPPRIFRRKKGEILLKTHDSSLIGKILGSARRALPEIVENSTDPKSSEVEHPLVQITAEAWSGECDRAIAKIGFNLLVHRIGKNQAADSAFDKIRKSIVDGHPQLPLVFLPDETEGSIKKNIFANIPANHHCLLLTPLVMPDGKVRILFAAVLYGSVGVWVELAEDSDLAILSEPVFYLVDFISNKITSLNIVEYTAKYNPATMERMRNEFSRLRI